MRLGRMDPAKNEKTVQGLAQAIVATLNWIHSHSAGRDHGEDARRPGRQRTSSSISPRSRIRSRCTRRPAPWTPKGAQAVLDVFSQSSPEIANAKIDLSKTYTNKYVEQVKKTSGTNTEVQVRIGSA